MKEVLADSRCRLRVLVLDYNGFEAEDIALIADGLAVNRSLRELSLEGNVVQGIGVKVILAKGYGYGMVYFVEHISCTSASPLHIYTRCAIPMVHAPRNTILIS